MKIIVQKFGGTSVANLECMQRVKEKVLRALIREVKWQLYSQPWLEKPIV